MLLCFFANNDKLYSNELNFHWAKSSVTSVHRDLRHCGHLFLDVLRGSVQVIFPNREQQDALLSISPPEFQERGIIALLDGTCIKTVNTASRARLAA